MSSFYWHDYETWGATPSIDRPSQFAGVRTDTDLNIIGEPLVIYCRPPRDILPWPEACLITGIRPQHAEQHGLVEAEFIEKIHRELAQPKTCAVGYNSLRFDDEITRYTLYRNYYDAYEREWRNGSSRWDIIDMMRLVYALRPDGIEWPMIDGKPSFKLELLTAANGIQHASAHDAFSDVEATIALAKLVKEKKPELYQFVLNNKSKQAAAKFFDVKARKPLLHISSKFPSSRGCCGLVVPLAAHPTNRNAVIVYELSVDPSELSSLSAEQIHQRVFVSNENLPEGKSRLPLKLIHLNKCPILAPAKMLDEKTAQRLGIDRAACEKHWHSLLPMDIEYKAREVFQLQQFAEKLDPEQKLYEGFIQDEDKKNMRAFRETAPEDLATINFCFDDARLNQMLIRYKARNYPDTLSEVEQKQWQEFCRERLTQGELGIQSMVQYLERISWLELENKDKPQALEILASLRSWGEFIKQE